MKKLSILIGIFVSLLLASCGGSQNTVGNPSSSPADQSKKATVVSGNTGIALYHLMAFYEEKDFKLVYSDSLNLGANVTILGDPETKKVGDKDSKMIKIKLDSGKEGWTYAYYIGKNCQLGVVKTEKATVYSKPDSLNPSKLFIKRLLVVAVQNEGTTDKFLKIIARDPEGNQDYTDVYLRKNDVTLEPMDVQAAISLTVAKSMKNADQKKEVLKSAKEDYASSMFIDDINKEYDALGGNPAAIKEIEDASGSFVVLENDVNVRSEPDETKDNVVAKIGIDKTVEVVKKTKQEYEVEGSKAFWYRITDPAGWVLGKFLKTK